MPDKDRVRLTMKRLEAIIDACEFILAGELPEGWDADTLHAASTWAAEELARRKRRIERGL